MNKVIGKCFLVLFGLVLLVSFCSLLFFGIDFTTKNSRGKIGTRSHIYFNTGQPAKVSEVYKLDVESNYDVINVESQITSPVFYICQDNVKTYYAPEAREEWVSGEIGRGELIKFSSVSNAHWVLISVDPTIEYVDLEYVCRK